MNKLLLKPRRGIDFIDKELSKKVFCDTINTLNEMGLNYWIDYGTLLGAYRDGDFIDSDMDIDISVMACDKLELMIDDLHKKGLDFQSDYFDVFDKHLMRKSNLLVNAFNKGEENKFTKIELVPVYESNDMYYKLTQLKEDGTIYAAGTTKLYFNEFTVIYFKGVYVRVPVETEKLLEYHYGDWEVPKNDISKTYKIPFVELDKYDLKL